MCFSLFKKKIEIPLSGCVPSPSDPRDALLSEMYPLPVRYAEEMPPAFDLDILTQDGPKCVGFSGAGIKQEKELRERRRIVFDGDWLYARCKEIDDYDGEGTYLRTLLKVLQKQGAKPLGQPESEASKYKIGAYAKVDDLSPEGLKKAYYISGVLLVGFTGSNPGWQTAYIRPPKPGETQWGHATFMIGYNKDYEIGQNSWGKTWGDNGKFYIPNNYMPFEAWAILTDMPSDAKEGYVAMEYLKSVGLEEGAKVSPITLLNFRDGMGLGANVIARVKPSDKLEIVEIGGMANGYNWAKVKILEE